MKKTVMILALLGNLFYSQAFAEDALKLAILDFPPYEFKTNNRIDGISVKIVKEVFEKMSQTISIELLPWSRALVYLEKGRIDGLFEILKKPEREKFADYSKVVLMSESVSFFVLKDSNITFDGDLNKLKDYTFGIRHDFSYGPKFDQTIKNNVITKISKLIYAEKLLVMLSYGRIDILIGDKYSIPYQYQKMRSNKEDRNFKRYKDIKRLSPDIQSTPAYIAFSKKSNLSKVRDDFDKVLLEMKNDGTYSKIIKTWEGTR
ncbi:MAG: transporter substrate-binding domain-containing protein [Desulfobacula sp.]|nr:transporter substrate-binding domain-containing protein [Desulfobacula sp.]